MKLIARPVGATTCGNDCGRPATCDVLTVFGSWAYLCDECSKRIATRSGRSIGYTWARDDEET